MKKASYQTNNWVLGQKIVRKNIEKIADFLDFIGSLLRYARRSERNYAVKEGVNILYAGKPPEFMA
jgi:hypothetical protein